MSDKPETPSQTMTRLIRETPPVRARQTLGAMLRRDMAKKKPAPAQPTPPNQAA
ncbi:hypothetical protein [Streptomyces sp. NRRL F-5630]|uniref:hypothetical protein n=1 Tax=Streptomyces sp. NRRL F-5630 TaxID=1463864 RepID=UPI003D73E10D